MSNPPVALVTGAANRIGAAIARVLHGAGYNVIVHYRNSADAAHALITDLNATRADSARSARADLAEFTQLEALARQSLAQWGRLDVLVNNASSFYPTTLDELDEGDWHDLMNSNARAPLFLSKHLHAALAATRGAIVNIVDSTALDGVAGFTPYTMAKAALANMTKSLARELAPQVRVNGVSPGAILWPEYAGGVSEEDKARTLAQTALGRMGTPEDIAHAVLFLARDASYVTGQVIAVDGGV
ncbi:MAG TPA: pteridine reductase [Pseudomonadales bacterium]